jgi:DnaJ-class molecular chaperone
MGDKKSNYEYDCPHCFGYGVVEHIEENIAEDCEHCKGTGRESGLTDSQVIAKNIIAFHNPSNQK